MSAEGLDGRTLEALRSVKADGTDKAALARLIVELWRYGKIQCDFTERPILIALRLSGGLTRSERREGMTHPWGSRSKRRGRGRGRWNQGHWWTLACGETWGERYGARPWVVGLTDAGDELAFNRDICKRFDTASELVEWLGPRLREWRVWERDERSPMLPPLKCEATLGPTRYPCIFDKGHAGQHCFLGRS